MRVFGREGGGGRVRVRVFDIHTYIHTCVSEFYRRDAARRRKPFAASHVARRLNAKLPIPLWRCV